VQDGPIDDAELGRTPGSSFRVVGIGASAGGLESLERFFGAMPVDSGMAFVVVQHLAPDFKTLMAELLARYSDMTISLAVDDEPIEPNHVYLLPPGKELEVRGGRLHLSHKQPHSIPQPIDVFFRSLAKDMGKRAVAIVLSGSGSDGSHGIVEVKAAGGVVLAESVETAGFNGMPASAAATGVVDFVGGPQELATFLSGAESPRPEPYYSTPEPPVPAPSEPVSQVMDLLDRHFGVDFARYKLTTVSRRLERRVGLKGLPDMAAYVDLLHEDPDELGSLYQDLLIGVTRFFRDPEAFAFVEDCVIPEILTRVPESEQIRVWVAGCATGEEAYSLALLFHEQMLRAGRPVNLKVLATDMHRGSLDTAATGVYTRELLAHLSPERRARYFVETPSAYQVSPELRSLVVFAPHNVMKDAPFTRTHLISCRNMLIYFRPEVQRSVLSLFHFGLASSGILLLGPSENVGGLSHEFTTLNERWKVYRKRRDIRLIDPMHLAPARAPERPPQLDGGRTQRVDPQLLASYDRLLDRFMPASFLIDENARLLDSFAGAERFLRAKSRRPTGSLLDMLEGDLRTVVAGALGRVSRERIPVTCPNVCVEEADGPQSYLVRLELLQQPRAERGHVLVTLERAEPLDTTVAEASSDGEVSVAQASRERMQSLEGELSYAREILQSTIEELETSNEELQATNEELVASNEELQSTNEELHSVNEELYTVNSEYQSKIEELQQLNADIGHLLEGTEVGTVFLDRDLRIRRYTERIGRVFRIQDRDLGREIRDFSYTLQRPTLIEDIERALHEGVPTEDEVRDERGRPHFLRILPYRLGPRLRGQGPDEPEGRPISGVVLTITDISALDRARQRLAQLSAIVESSEDAILRKDLSGRIETWNKAAERLYGYTAEEAVGKDVRFLCTKEGAKDVDRFLAAIRRGERIDHVETVRIRKDGKHLDVSVSISPVLDEDGRVVAASTIARDITPLRTAQREAEERQQEIQKLLDSTAEAIYGVDVQGICTFCNRACTQLLGYRDPSELVGRDMHELVHRGRLATSPHECRLTSALRGGGPSHSSDEVFWRADGTFFAAEYWSHPVERDGKVTGAVVTFLDITERRQAEEEVRAAARRRERFLALLSHELRNPLAAILNAIRVVSAETGARELELRARSVVDRQGQHMARLLDDLLDVSRITSGKFELRKERVRIDDAVTAAIEALEPLLRDHGLTLTTSLGSTPLFVDGDGARLQQVVANLLSNAARYSPSGSRVELSLRSEGSSAVLSVRDWGVGIEPAFLPHVFDLFAQSEQAARVARGGLGIGLTLVRRIVELHDGTVEAKSAGAGLGSEFVVRIPCSTGRTDRTSQPPVDGLEQCRIVLVEDQQDAREMLRALLELRGHTVVDVGDAQEAIATIARELPDVAVVDIGLAELSGYDVARAVRSGPGGDRIFMVALTGYGSQADVRAAEEAGFDVHLTKPAEPERLFQLLARRAPSESRRRSGAWSEMEGRERSDPTATGRDMN
jgi:two-component system CheB/CheR fusion protein